MLSNFTMKIHDFFNEFYLTQQLGIYVGSLRMMKYVISKNVLKMSANLLDGHIKGSFSCINKIDEHINAPSKG